MSTIAFTGKTWTLWATLGFIFREPDRGSVTVVQSSTSLPGKTKNTLSVDQNNFFKFNAETLI